MVSRRFIVFTVFLLMLAAAPVWANTANIADLPRIDSPVRSDGILDDDDLDSLTTTDRTFFLKIGYAWTP
jgi:hypothetical protein